MKYEIKTVEQLHHFPFNEVYAYVFTVDSLSMFRQIDNIEKLYENVDPKMPFIIYPKVGNKLYNITPWQQCLCIYKDWQFRLSGQPLGYVDNVYPSSDEREDPVHMLGEIQDAIQDCYNTWYDWDDDDQEIELSDWLTVNDDGKIAINWDDFWFDVTVYSRIRLFTINSQYYVDMEVIQ